MVLENRICVGCGKEFKADIKSSQKFHSRHCANRNKKPIQPKRIPNYTLHFPDFSIDFFTDPVKIRDKRTKPEKIFYDFLESNNLKLDEDFIYQYRVLNYHVDFFFPKINLGVEIDGDYWHANPSRYKSTDLIKYPSGLILAKDIWKKDKEREKLINQHIQLKRIWESDLLEQKYEEEILNILVGVQFKLQ
jgi:G:T-mismatch repair DNA endonuclease (very short patch repair protein)